MRILILTLLLFVSVQAFSDNSRIIYHHPLEYLKTDLFPFDKYQMQSFKQHKVESLVLNSIGEKKVFCFNKNGLLLEQTFYRIDDSTNVLVYKIEYKYNQKSKLICKSQYFPLSNEVKFDSLQYDIKGRYTLVSQGSYQFIRGKVSDLKHKHRYSFKRSDNNQVVLENLQGSIVFNNNNLLMKAFIQGRTDSLSFTRIDPSHIIHTYWVKSEEDSKYKKGMEINYQYKNKTLVKRWELNSFKSYTYKYTYHTNQLIEKDLNTSLQSKMYFSYFNGLIDLHYYTDKRGDITLSTYQYFYFE